MTCNFLRSRTEFARVDCNAMISSTSDSEERKRDKRFLTPNPASDRVFLSETTRDGPQRSGETWHRVRRREGRGAPVTDPAGHGTPGLHGSYRQTTSPLIYLQLDRIHRRCLILKPKYCYVTAL